MRVRNPYESARGLAMSVAGVTVEVGADGWFDLPDDAAGAIEAVRAFGWETGPALPPAPLPGEDGDGEDGEDADAEESPRGGRGRGRRG